MRLIPLIAIALSAAASVRAQQKHAGPPMGMDSSAFEDLQLTADQRSRIQAIHERVQREDAPLRQEMRQMVGGKSYHDLTQAERDSLASKLMPLWRQLRENNRK